MIKELDKRSVNTFLKICSKQIKNNRCYFLANRYIYINGKMISALQALVNLNIMSISDIWKYVLRLNNEECIKIGKDYNSTFDNNTEMYVFLKHINHKDAYIKLTVNDKGLLCLSFHESSKIK